MKKRCSKCGKQKMINAFYKHPNTFDGYFNKCKDCTKLDTLKHRYKNIEHFKEYDRQRAHLPHRIKLRQQYSENEINRERARKIKAIWVINNPEKRKASIKKYKENNKEKTNAQGRLYYAVKVGKVKKMPCIVCKNPISHAHHEDYSKPLDVIWLCAYCHKQAHKN